MNYRRLQKSVTDQGAVSVSMTRVYSIPFVCMCAHVCMWVYFFVGGWGGGWEELQNIMQSTDMNNSSVYKFQSQSSQLKKLFAAHFSSCCTSLYVTLSNFQNCYKILWKLLLWPPQKIYIWRNEPPHHAFISYPIYKKWVKIILR